MSTAERMKRYRRRMQRGLCVVPVEVNVNMLADYLISRRMIAIEQSEDVDALGRVISKWVEAAINRDA